MNVDTVTTFLALLAVLGLLFMAAVAVLALVSVLRGGLPAWAVPLREGIGEVALILGFAVALTTSLGSLYLSEVAKFPPCILCWYQRICMYPTVVILAVAILRRDAKVKFYVLPLVLIGAAFSTYHYLIERFPEQVSYSCEADVPCSTVWVWKFHFLSIPGMAWVGFLLIGTLVLLARPAAAGPSPAPTLSQSDSEEIRA